MKSKNSILTTVVALFLSFVSSCGEDSADPTSDTVIEAEVLGSGGMFFVGQLFDGASAESNLMYYDFSKGEISSLAKNLAFDSVVLPGHADFMLVERSSKPSFRKFKKATIDSAKPINLSSAKSDPWQIAEMASGNQIVANRSGQNLVVLDKDTGNQIQKYTAESFALSQFYPTAIYTNGTTVFVISQGFDGTSFAQSKLLKLSFASQALSLVKVIDIEASLVGQILNESSSSFIVAGLCPASTSTSSGCLSGAFEVDQESLALKSLSLNSTYLFYNHLFSGESEGIIYGSVQDSLGMRYVVKFNLSSGTVNVIHNYSSSSDRLYLATYSSGVAKILIGDEADSQGVMHVYNTEGKKIKSITSSSLGRPYQGIFAP